MPIDPNEIRERYASMSDDELVVMDREDLTREAQKIFEAELRRRGLDPSKLRDEDYPPLRDGDEEPGFAVNEEGDKHPVWLDLEKTFTVTTFSGTPAGIADAADARAALVAAGIPCEVTEHEIDPGEEPVPDPYREYRVMVPDAFGLQAASVLDTAIFNARVEGDWKTQLESLSDDELKALNVDALCAGLLDRAERLRKAYKKEIARRGA